MDLMKIKKNYQLTIPRNLRAKFNLAEGDYVEINIRDKSIVLTPVKVIPSDQEYFHTKEWQKKEKEADEDIRNGRVSGSFDNAKDLVKALNA